MRSNRHTAGRLLWPPLLLSLCASAAAIFSPPAQASSHREALAILNEPCADNTDTYAWVKPGTHDKLYLVMNFNPLHEPGQGNQGCAPATATATSSTSAWARA